MSHGKDALDAIRGILIEMIKSTSMELIAYVLGVISPHDFDMGNIGRYGLQRDSGLQSV